MSSVESGSLLSGWGRILPSRARIVRPSSAEGIAEALAAASAERGGVIARGAGRSYGDAAQNGGGTVLDATGVGGILALDRDRGEVRAGTGTSFAELLRHLAEHGLTLPVVPGTRHLTVGGAIASDVHGKNHPRDGSLARHLVSFTLCTPAGGPAAVSRQQDAALFDATVGGMGLTGVITEAVLRTIPMRSRFALADVDRSETFEDALELMAGETSQRYSIAWVDLLAEGPAFGRAIVTRSEEGPVPGEHSNGRAGQGPWRGKLRGRQGASPRGAPPFPMHPRVGVPRGFPRGLLRPATVRAFNALHWRSTPRSERGRTLSMSAQLFPLDVLGDWNRLYGPGGLVQYQFAVPNGHEQTMRAVVELLRARHLPMYLAVLKRFGAASGGMLSFPLPGWTLAIDLPADAPGLRSGLDDADELVVAAGGRVYLAKDARARSHTLAAMYPRLADFRTLRERIDPGETMRSDMARRLELSG